MKTYSCLHCGKECKVSSNKLNKFCSNACQGSYKWEHKTKPRIERGECTHNSGGTLKRYLVETRGDVCQECGQTSVWNSMELVLQLDHIDGDSDNNYPSNLRLLCPNCHSQTETFGSKGKGNRYKKNSLRNKYLREYKGLVA